MKKKRYIKTVEDIKYCEENGLTIYPTHGIDCCYEFENGHWNQCSQDGELWMYALGIDMEIEPYYYEEEPMQEATEDDIGKLCWFWDDSEKYKSIGILDEYDKYGEECKYFSRCSGNYRNGRRLSPAEVAEITGYKVEKAE